MEPVFFYCHIPLVTCSSLIIFRFEFGASFFYCHVPLVTRTSLIIFRLEFGASFFFLLPRCTSHVVLTTPSTTFMPFTPASRQSPPSPSFLLCHAPPHVTEISVLDGSCAGGHLGVPILQSLPHVSSGNLYSLHITHITVTGLHHTNLRQLNAPLYVIFHVFSYYSYY